MKLLIIEDERDLSNSIVTYLSSENYLCEQAFTYNEAKDKINLYDYDCILLDLMLPGGNGLDVLREIRHKKPGWGNHHICQRLFGRQNKRFGNRGR